MSTKMLGVVDRGWGHKKVGIEIKSNDFYPNAIPTGDVPNFSPDIARRTTIIFFPSVVNKFNLKTRTPGGILIL